MTRATLAEVLQPALAGGYAIGGLVVLGWEDARAFVAAAEAENVPVILQAGPGARRHTPLPVLAKMFELLARQAAVPVVSHLDHSSDEAECRMALDLGFTSVMFDGSALPLADNITRTAKVVEMAHAAGASCEGEIGFVGYAEGKASRMTDPQEAARFATETGIDAMAISVGNVHLQTEPTEGVDRAALAAIEAVTNVPLVLHGGSGIPRATRTALARDTAVCKFNIGTELRQAFGAGLRKVLTDEKLFDRIAILGAVEPMIVEEARSILRDLKA